MGKRIPVVTMKHLQSNLPEDKVSPQDREATADKHEPNPQPPSAVDENSSGKNKEQAGNGENDYPSNVQAMQEFFRREPITAQWFFNGVVAVFTALTWYATYLQYTAQMLDQRPWVGAYEIILGKFTPGEQVRMEVVLRNSGKTPALSMKNKIRGVAVYGIPEEPPNIPPIALYVSEMVLMPNQTSRIHPVGMVPLTQADFNNVMVKKDWVFVVWGKITYTDKFQVEGETTLCAYYIPEIQRFGACTKGNSAK